MSKFRAAALALLAIPAAASAQSMNAETFYQKAVALKSRGPLALFSSDLKPLMREGQASGQAAATARKAALAAHQTPRYCPPTDVHGMAQQEFLDRLAAIPQADRRAITMQEAMNRILGAKYPCRRS